MEISNLTPEQEAAVKHRGSALLVSAAAGSGKTKVLVERLLGRIEDGDSVDEFLIITYTRAAASELRERIHDKLLERIAENTENRHLRRQSMLCRGAPIGTIHSFCTDVLRENAYAVGVPPDFRVADENESESLKAEVLEKVLNEAYETIEGSEGFRALVDATLAGRDDRRLIEMVLDAHRKLQSIPDPRKWVEEQIETLALSGAEDISETVWGAFLIEKTRGKLQFWRDETAKLREEMRSHPDFERAYGPGIDTAIAGCEAFLGALDKGWDEVRLCGGIEFPRPKPIKGYDDLKSARLKCKAELGKCIDVFACSSAEHIEDMLAVAPATKALLKLILDFGDAYSAKKKDRGVVDFSDLEHQALALLIDSETGKKTELARSISGKIKEIMVDEYQDVNAIQELIFSAVSQEEKNIFMVGDVKQSIYRFRLADPSIFLRKYKSAAALRSREQGSGVRGQETGTVARGENVVTSTPGSSLLTPDSPLQLVLLSRNFRSRPGILGFVNYLFERIMSEEFGEMDYTEGDRLVPGREEGAAEPRNAECRMQNAEMRDVSNEEEGMGAAVEFDIIDMSAVEGDEEEESPTKVQAEARFIAERISELAGGGYTVPDGQGNERRVRYSDIVILLRSMSGKASSYSDALSEYGIPADMPGTDGFLETIEVSAALSLLSVIDNPMQDTPLAAVLRGPVYGFTADELAWIRARSQGTDYYSALLKASETDEKCKAFLDEIDSLRELSPDMPAFKFIWHVYNKTGLLDRVGSMRGGNKRRSNLTLLAEYARRFEQSGYKGLFGFLTHIRALQEKGVELAGYDAELSQDTVRIMSIHKSKGLEFPIVFLADTSKQFNYTDMNKPLVLHPGLGAGLMRIDRQRRIEYPTIARMAIQSKLKAEMLAEELRILYVAMTRAREKLIITAAFKDAGAAMGAAEPRLREQGSGIRAQETGDAEGIIPLRENVAASIPNSELLGRVPPQVLEDTKSMAGWMLAALGAAMPRNAECRMQNVEMGTREARGQGSGIRAQETGDAEGIIPLRENVATSIPYSEFRIQNSLPIDVLNKRFAFTYPHGRAPELPSKLTVTGLKGRWIDAEASIDAETALFAKPTEPKGREFSFDKPGFIQEKTGLTAAERGTALHLAMQYIDFGKCATEDGIGSELQRFVAMGWLSDMQAAAIDITKIKRFFESDIGKRLLKAESIKREFKFSLLYPAERFFPGGGEDKILLQGIVDCFFEENGELVVIDFKTDYVTTDTLEEKAKGYARQIAEYSEALGRITGKRVKERIIYFIGASLWQMN